MRNYPSIHRIVALAVLLLLATGLNGGISVHGIGLDNQPFTWPDERAYAAYFSMFFEDENRAPGQPLACRPLEPLSDAEQPQGSATPHANLYLIVSPTGDRNEGCLVEPWKVPSSILPWTSPAEELEIVVTPEQWIPSSETLGTAPPDLAVLVNASEPGASNSESIWVPLEATSNAGMTSYIRLIEGQKRLVFRTPLEETVNLQIAGYHLENRRSKGRLKRATEVLWGSLAGASGLLAPFQGVFGGTGRILAALRTIQNKNKELEEAFEDIAKVQGENHKKLLTTSLAGLHVAVGGSAGRSKLAKGRWLALANGARFRGYGLRVTGLEGAGAPAVLQVARKPDGTEPTNDEREALGFDDYVIFELDVQDVPTRLEDRHRIQSARSAASESRDLVIMMERRALSKQAVLDFIAKWEHFSPVAEYVSAWRSHLEAVRADQVEWSEENRVVPRNSKALLISVGTFGTENIRPIAGMENDRLLMREVAEALGVTDVRELRDETATAGEIRNALRELTTGTGPDDLILVYFSGYGGTNGLVAHDTDTIPGTEGELSNLVGVGEFIDELGAIPSRRVLAVLDGSGPIELGSLPANVAVMQATTSSTTPAQMVPEGSLFTVVLHAAVSALQAQNEPALSVRELFMATLASVEPLAPAGLEPQQVPRPSLVSSWTSQQRVRLLPPWQFFSRRIYDATYDATRRPASDVTK